MKTRIKPQSRRRLALSHMREKISKVNLRRKLKPADAVVSDESPASPNAEVAEVLAQVVPYSPVILGLTSNNDLCTWESDFRLFYTDPDGTKVVNMMLYRFLKTHLEIFKDSCARLDCSSFDMESIRNQKVGLNIAEMPAYRAILSEVEKLGTNLIKAH